MTEYNFDDFKRQLTIQDLLEYAGYRQDKKAGLKYPIYIKLDSMGKPVHGDKFMVTGRGNCCVRPGTTYNYNIISFITEHPTLFPQFRPGMSPHRLVNLVCNELLNNPIEHTELRSYHAQKESAPFDLDKYNVFRFLPRSYESQQAFDPFFKDRGIDQYTLHTFKDHFFLTSKKEENKFSYRNLSFPLTIPGKEGVVGLEERGRPDKEGKTYKGKAAGSNGSEGLWIVNLANKPLDKANKVLWFESAYDAMAYYQLHRDNPQMTEAVYVSTGGSPTENQFKGVLSQTGNAIHHLCFDNDDAGRTFTANFIMVSDGQRAGTTTAASNPEQFTLDAIRSRLKEDTTVRVIPPEFNDYVNSLLWRDKIYSGEPDLLPSSVRLQYIKYEKLAQELFSATKSGIRMHPDDYNKLKTETNEALEPYKQIMEKTLGKGDGLMVMRLLPEEPYKDWNEQLLASIEHKQEQTQEEKTEYHFHR